VTRWVLVSALACVLGMAALLVVVARLPRDFFVRDGSGRRRSLVVRILKNVCGVALIVVGIVLSLPIVPGPGFLAILLGLAMTDIPGKRRVIRAAVRKPAVSRKLNGLRRRLGRPSFLLPGPAS
jgi:hypothetical protein